MRKRPPQTEPVPEVKESRHRPLSKIQCTSHEPRPNPLCIAESFHIPFIRNLRCCCCCWSGHRQLSERRHPPPASGRIHCLSKLSLPSLRHSDSSLRQHSACQLRGSAR